VLHRAELVREVRLPRADGDTRTAYEKFRLRNSIDFPILSVAASLEVRDGAVCGARVVLGAAAPVPLRVRLVEQALVGVDADPAALSPAARQAAEAWARTCTPLTPNAYKVRIATALIRRAVEKAAAQR
jgi:CO/xanthine dehydrogenase FAD-binding subunit